MSFEVALHQWQEGERRVRDAPPDRRPTLERVVERTVAELRRRLGGAFSAQELLDLYQDGSGWALTLAHSVAPDAPWAWEARTVTDAAFGRYLREASDFAGGRRSVA